MTVNPGLKGDSGRKEFERTLNPSIAVRESTVERAPMAPRPEKGRERSRKTDMGRA